LGETKFHTYTPYLGFIINLYLLIVFVVRAGDTGEKIILALVEAVYHMKICTTLVDMIGVMLGITPDNREKPFSKL